MEDPSISPVYLQIYNRDVGEWETMDSESLAENDTKFTLTGTQSDNLEHYFDENYIIVCRVYQ